MTAVGDPRWRDTTTSAAPTLWRGQSLAVSQPVAAEAHEALRRALLAADELRVPCQEGMGARWLSEVQEERQAAARLCIDCPVWAACAAAGADEPWGVWAGVDRSGPEAVAQRRRRGLTAA